ncbi:hypothetical protein [Poseidonibacter ostreae]|jgi:hypothetical protein|uniref:Porin n=1 Tax=Poseidonibacter ostreae TaxID=2654171 RepID=A0A6L4WP26_9BACT|nr:hypothetical protein [Poseidonibacter ostreae]KAB7884826.1 hypothetical protein GBG19_15255 [Poseidonibacter ostreae]KAB7885834.1 hypothetical protein GA417_07150 [Poseidonibacter ostreae]KAB7887156.1 hypothetical protein GBG18_14205 [Poseidonibacter ostreae]
MLDSFFKIIIFLLFSFIFLKAEQLSDSFRLDGYGNISMNKSKLKNKDKLDFSGGLQGRYQISDNISITGQIHLKEGLNSQGRESNSLSDYDSELKWLYIDYYFKNDITLRAGALQFPVFKSSETGDIGYTYTWTKTPLSFYGVFGCDDFKGIELLKNFSYKDFDFLAQVSYGKSENELSDGRGNTREGDVDNLVGLTLKTTHNNFLLNIGYLQADSTIVTRNNSDIIDSNVDFSMYALESEIYLDNYTLKSGLIKTNLTNVFPEDIKYYTSLEYSFEDFTPYILYSNEILNFKNNSNTSPDLRRVITDKMNIEKYSLGLKYDYSENIVFKTSFTHEKEFLKYIDSEDKRNSNDTFIGSINFVF